MNAMLEEYMHKSYAKHFIIGFEYNKVIYMFITNNYKVFEAITREEQSSRNQGKALRLRLRKHDKGFLVNNAIALCTKAKFNEEYENSKYNRGEIFEKLVFENYGFRWSKNNEKFSKTGDISIKDIAYQIKYQNATITNEKILSHT